MKIQHPQQLTAPILTQYQETNSNFLSKNIVKLALVSAVALGAVYSISLISKNYEKSISPCREGHLVSQSLTREFYDQYANGCNSAGYFVQNIYLSLFEKPTKDGLPGALKAFICDRNNEAVACSLKNRLAIFHVFSRESRTRDQRLLSLFNSACRHAKSHFYLSDWLSTTYQFSAHIASHFRKKIDVKAFLVGLPTKASKLLYSFKLNA